MTRGHGSAEHHWEDARLEEQLLAFMEHLLTLYPARASVEGGTIRRITYTFTPAQACQDLGMSRAVFDEEFLRLRDAFGWQWDATTNTLTIQEVES